MDAVVLAAGKGERLWPLTENRPKPMIPVANRPILEHILEALIDAGASNVVLVVGSNRERVQSHFEDGQDWNVEITYAVQSQQLGTGHALLQAEPYLGESFVALNGDRIIDDTIIRQVWDEHNASGDPVVSITSAETPSEYGVVELDGAEVTSIAEQPPSALTKSNLINAGVYGFTSDIFAAIRKTESRGEKAITDTLESVLSQQTIRSVKSDETWLDVSEPWDLLQMNSALLSHENSSTSQATTESASAITAESTNFGDGVVLQPQATVLRDTTLGDNVTVAPHAILEDTIILPDSKIKAGAVVNDCIVGANTTIGPNTTIEGGTTNVALNGELYEDVTFGALIGDNVDIGANVTIQPGTIIGNNATIDSGAVVSGRIDEGSHVMRG